MAQKSLRLPTFADIQRRRSELLAQQGKHAPAEEPVEEEREEEQQPAPTSLPSSKTPAWPTISRAAYYGLAGLAVNTIAPHTEADPAAVILQFLAAFGNIGHITQYELSRHLHPTDAHNGFANRCLWTCAQRSQLLPEGGNLASEDLAGVARELRRTLHWVGSATAEPWRRDAAARHLWNKHYPSLSQARPGLYGAATTRAEAQVLRLSAIYAALDCSPVIATPHLEAALAVWDYCFFSAGCVFGTATGDATADRIHRALNASPDGLTREQIRKLFHGHVSSECIDNALGQLSDLGTVTVSTSHGKGRPGTHWAAVEAENPVLQ